MNAAHRKLAEKALTDPAFKAELLKSPTSTVEKTLGIKLPAGLTIKILEDSASAVHLVVPVGVEEGKGELTEGELSQVAGGQRRVTSASMFPCDNTIQQQWVCPPK